MSNGRVTAYEMKQTIMNRLEEAIAEKKAKALQTKPEREAYYIVHEVDGLVEALNIVKGIK